MSETPPPPNFANIMNTITSESLEWIVLLYIVRMKIVSGWGPGFDLGPKNVYFGETYIKEKNSDTQIFGLITKM